MPSKVTDYKESTLANLPKILKALDKDAMNPQQLFAATKDILMMLANLLSP